MNHHAYIYEGPLALRETLAQDAAERFGFVRDHNPDVHTEEWQKFGIDDARRLSEEASLKSTSGRALFVLAIGAITSEAQQALLKLFEEPQEGLIFVVLVPHGVLLPTVRSRFSSYPTVLEKAPGGASLAKGSMASEAKTFLSQPYKDRSDWIAGFLKKDDDSLREQARNFFNALEAQLYMKFQTSPDREVREGLEDIGHFRQYLADRSPSLKMLLEHFAATLPLLR